MTAPLEIDTHALERLRRSIAMEAPRSWVLQREQALQLVTALLEHVRASEAQGAAEATEAAKAELRRHMT